MEWLVKPGGKMNMNKITWIILLSTALLGRGIAANITITAGAEPSSVAPGEEFSYTIRVQSDSLGHLPEPTLPPLDNFTILSGPNKSQSFQFINGRMSGELIYSYSLRAASAGRFTIQPATIKVDGQEVKSEAVTVTVAQTPSTNIPAPMKNENIPRPSTSNEQLRQALEGKLFLRAEVDNKTPYVGQPVVVAYTLYAKKGLPLVTWGVSQPLPQFKAFLKEDLYNTERLTFHDVKLGSEAYQAALVKKIILVPTKTGKTMVDNLNLVVGLNVQSSERRRSRRSFEDPFFDDFFFDPFGRQAEQVTVPSSVIELNVQNLPSPLPADFTGTVGDYTFTVKLDRNSATMDDLVTLSLSLSGKGAVESALEPKIPSIEGFEVYETKARVDKKITADTLGGTKNFDIVLRPQKTGEMEIPPISYTLFNPEKKEYVTLKSSPIKLTITPGTAKTPLVIAGQSPGISSSGGTIVEINADINYIKSGERIGMKSIRPLILSGWFLELHLLPPLLLAVAYYIRRRREALEGNMGLVRRLRARGVAGRRLKTAVAALSRGDSNLFYTELASAIRGFFGDMLNREAHGLTIDSLAELLRGCGISEENISPVRSLLEEADSVRYSPSIHTTEDMRAHYEQAFRIIQEFRKKL
jgi:hypothetical protein